MFKKALIIYFSSTGNTKKVALAIYVGLEAEGILVELKKPQEAANIDFYDYDLVCVGRPRLSGNQQNP